MNRSQTSISLSRFFFGRIQGNYPINKIDFTGFSPVAFADIYQNMNPRHLNFGIRMTEHDVLTAGRLPATSARAICKIL